VKVIHPKNLPSKLPLLLTAVAWLMLDRLQPAGWVHGVVYTIIAILWIISIVGMVREQQLDIFTR
jgi:hypothetical protein